MKIIDINVDVAEGFLFDEDLLMVATSANICCGAHAGNSDLTISTIDRCKKNGIRIGAHVGVGDRDAMGRAPVPLESDENYQSLLCDLIRQVEISEWSYIKPHGWLYNASAQEGYANLVVRDLVNHIKLPLLGLPNTRHEEIAHICGVKFFREGFADRRYQLDGQLVPRKQPNAVLIDEHEITSQVVYLANEVDSICIHGDTPNCVVIAKLVRTTLELNGYEVKAWP